jgi:hypothetical protein
VKQPRDPDGSAAIGSWRGQNTQLRCANCSTTTGGPRSLRKALNSKKPTRNPFYERHGIGRALLPRAERFYCIDGWIETGRNEDGQIIFQKSI